MQQQQHADYDLLAVFSDEEKADAATTKLRKEGFGDEEVYQLTAGTVGAGQFRDHGPNSARGEFFLQTKRSGPNPLFVLLFAVIFGLVLGGLSFAATFALPTLPEPLTLVVGVIVGIVLGALLGLFQRGRERGNIGQKQSSQSSQSKISPSSGRATSSALTVVALRFPDQDNISRKSRARAILLNNGGRIDRSVGKRE